MPRQVLYSMYAHVRTTIQLAAAVAAMDISPPISACPIAVLSVRFQSMRGVSKTIARAMTLLGAYFRT
eukprot:1963-Eustigmatos_ZCMA.PRE.1